jgi:hypothetical protein
MNHYDDLMSRIDRINRIQAKTKATSVAEKANVLKMHP